MAELPYIVYVKRIPNPNEPTLGFVVATFGPYATDTLATAAATTIRRNHTRFADLSAYYIGTMPLHPAE